MASTQRKYHVECASQGPHPGGVNPAKITGESIPLEPIGHMFFRTRYLNAYRYL